jgi:8-oxo-dGTP diphosphatase
MKIVPVAIAIIENNNKYLLTKRIISDREDKKFYPSVWNFPGGGIEFGENPEDSLRREMKEELNVEINIVTLLPKIFTDVRNNWQGLFLCFLCHMKNKDATITLNEEASEYRWLTIDEIIKLKLMPKTFEMAREADRIITK